MTEYNLVAVAGVVSEDVDLADLFAVAGGASGNWMILNWH